MKTHLKLLLAALAGLFITTLAFADETTVTVSGGFTPDKIVALLTPIIVPVILVVFKKAQPSLPSWLIPLLAPVLGVAIEYVNSLFTQHANNFLLAALLGLAGVGLREIKDQVKPAQNGGWPTP